jgi:hypothetical protein
MTEQFRPLLDENRRPFTKHEKKMWKIRHEPRGFEYQLIPLWQLEGRPEPGQQPEPEQKMSLLGFLGFLFLTFLDAIIDLPEYKELGIDGEGKRETPQDTLTAKS